VGDDAAADRMPVLLLSRPAVRLAASAWPVIVNPLRRSSM